MNLLAVSFVVLLTAGFLIPGEPVWAILFYAAVLPLLLRDLYCRGAPRAATGLWLGTALILWCSLCALFDPAGTIVERVRWVGNGLCTEGFLIAGWMTFSQAGEPWRERGISAMIVAASLNAAASIAWFAVFARSEPRLVGFGETRQAILGAAVITVPALLAAGRAIRRQRPTFHLSAVLLAVAFVALTDSRGPILAIVAGLVVLLAGTRPRLPAPLMLVPIGAGIVAALEPALAADVMHRLTERGLSFRPELWRVALHTIAQRPLLGFGPAAQLTGAAEFLAPGTGLFPHDLLLSTVFYSGAIGGALLLLVLGYAWWAAGRAPDRVSCWTSRALLTSLVVNGITDLGGVTKGPSQMWYIFWLPALFALTAPRIASLAKEAKPPAMTQRLETLPS